MRSLRPELALALTLTAAHASAESGLNVWRGRVSGKAFTSPVYEVEAFDRAVLSWNASGAAVFELEADGNGNWRDMGHWGPQPRSQSGPEVDVDTLVLKTPARSIRFRVTPTKGAVVTLAAVTTWKAGTREPLSRQTSPAWGKILEVPQRSQSVERKDPGDICSPTSLSMVLEYHGTKKPTAAVAAGVLDHSKDRVYGNWPFNTAYAHAVSGREAYVRRFSSLAGLEAEIAEGRPVVISHKFKKGDLDGAPINATNGHLIVVVGFDDKGDVVVNDPAAPPASVRRTYKRDQIQKTWLELANGIAYILK